MGPGQASTQDQSVQALMIHLCELKKCVGTLQWAEHPSTLRHKIPARIGCEHKGLSCIHTRLGGYRLYDGLNPELWAIPPLPPLPFFFSRFFSSKIAFRKCISSPRFQLSNRCPASSKYTDSTRCPAGTFPSIAPLINTSVKWFSSPPLASLSCFHPLSRLPQTYFETTHSPASICGKQKQLGFPSIFLDSECFLDQLIHLPSNELAGLQWKRGWGWICMWMAVVQFFISKVT